MTLPERLKYLRLVQPAYLRATRRERSSMLDEAERVTHRHRKSLIRRLNGKLKRKPRARQRGRSYGPEVESAVRLVARSLDFPCAERLQPALVGMAQTLASHGEVVLSPHLLDRLGRGSVSTGGRLGQRSRPDPPPPPPPPPATCLIRATSKSIWFITAEIAPTASTSTPCN